MLGVSYLTNSCKLSCEGPLLSSCESQVASFKIRVASYKVRVANGHLSLSHRVNKYD
jgi:hypothetical protein